MSTIPTSPISLPKNQMLTSPPLQLTSLSNKPLLDYHVGYRANYLPIHPAPAHPDTGKLLFLANNIYLQKDTYVKTKTVYCIPRFLLGGEYLDKQRGQPIQLCLESLNMVFNQALGVDTGYYGDDNGYHDDITAFQQPQQFQLNPWAYEFVPNAAFTAVLQPQFTPVEAYEPALSYPSKPLWSTIAAAGLAI